MGNSTLSTPKSFDQDCYDTTCASSKTITHSVVNKLAFAPPAFPKKDNEDILRNLGIQFIQHNNKHVAYKLYKYLNSSNYIVFAHGNASDITHMSHYCQHLSQVAQSNVLMFEYPGYLSSNETPCESGCYENITITVDYLVKTKSIDPKNIYLVGQSLGSGIVAHFAATNKWDTSIMLISPYKTIGSIAIDNNNSSCRAIRASLDMFETVHKIHKITAPIMIVHGETDEVINIEHGKTLYEKTVNKLPPVWIPNCGHNDILNRIGAGTWKRFMNII